MKVFISGRVTGLPRHEAEHNFARGEKLLVDNNYEFVNPLRLVPVGTSNRDAMAVLLPVLTRNCDAILLLNDTKFSEGSQVEETVARYCGLQILYEDDLI